VLQRELIPDKKGKVNYLDFKKGLLSLLSGCIEQETNQSTKINDNNIGTQRNTELEITKTTEEKRYQRRSKVNLKDSSKKSTNQTLSNGKSHYRTSRISKTENKNKEFHRNSKPYRTSKNHRKNECGLKVISETSTNLTTSEVLNTDEAGDGFLAYERAAVEETTPKEALKKVWTNVIGSLKKQINIDDLALLYQSLQIQTTHEELNQLFNLLDHNNSGFITFYDFIEKIPAKDKVSDPTTTDSLSLSKKSPTTINSKTIKTSSPTSFIYENEDFMEPYNRPSTIDNRTNKRPSSQKHNKKGVILPFNHPKYKRYLAEMPLFYLADDCDHRRLHVEILISAWKQQGFQNYDEVIEKLGIDREASFGLETISEIIEEITNENILHEGICALYKQGIKAAKSQLKITKDSKELHAEIKNLKSKNKELIKKFKSLESNLNEINLQYTNQKQVQKKLEATNRSLKDENKMLWGDIKKHNENQRNLIEIKSKAFEDMKLLFKQTQKNYNENETRISEFLLKFKQDAAESSKRSKELEDKLNTIFSTPF